jgi:hypothetical protein
MAKNRKFYDWLSHNRWLSFIITSIPTVITVFISIFGNFIDNNGKLTSAWLYFVVIALTISSIFSIIKFQAQKGRDTERENANQFYKDILEKDSTFLLARMNKFLQITTDNEKKDVFRADDYNLLGVVSPLNPLETIKLKIEYTCELFNKLFDIPQNLIGVSIIYNRNSVWEYLCEVNIEGRSLPLATLTSNSHSTFNIVRDAGPRCYRFFPDKNTARRTQQYIPDRSEQDIIDNNGTIIGSIYCSNISVMQGENILFEAVLSVTTYDWQMCDEDDQVALYRIRQMFLHIEDELKYELAKLCAYGHSGLLDTIGVSNKNLSD